MYGVKLLRASHMDLTEQWCWILKVDLLTQVCPNFPGDPPSQCHRHTLSRTILLSDGSANTPNFYPFPLGFAVIGPPNVVPTINLPPDDRINEFPKELRRRTFEQSGSILHFDLWAGRNCIVRISGQSVIPDGILCPDLLLLSRETRMLHVQ